MNPLDKQEPFEFEGMNPNPTFSKTKDGAIYRISFEVHRELWDEFVEANTSGMIIGASMYVVESHGKPEPKEKGGKMSIQAGIICKEVRFQEYCVHLLNNSKPEVNHELCEQTARNTIYRICRINSRRELDQLEEAKGIFKELMRKYNIWADQNQIKA